MNNHEKKWYEISKDVLQLYKSLNDFSRVLYKCKPEDAEKEVRIKPRPAGIKIPVPNTHVLRWQESLRDGLY